jgi:peptidoglycan hydrolase CwlO-like protein
MDVSAQQISGSSALDEKPDARTTNGTAAAATKPVQDTAAQAQQPLPTNRDAELKKIRDKQAKKQAKLDKKKKKSEEEPANPKPTSTSGQSQSTQGAQTPTGTPNPAAQPSGTNPLNPLAKP